MSAESKVAAPKGVATERNAQGVDVLALVRKEAAHHVALSGSDAYSAQEAPKWMEAAVAIGELVEADLEYDAAMHSEADTDGMLRREAARARRAAALARATGAEA